MLCDKEVSVNKRINIHIDKFNKIRNQGQKESQKTKTYLGTKIILLKTLWVKPKIMLKLYNNQNCYRKLLHKIYEIQLRQYSVKSVALKTFTLIKLKSNELIVQLRNKLIIYKS